MPHKPMPILSQSDLARFWSKIHKTDYCWVWLDEPSEAGYGRIEIDYIAYFSHRISYWVAYQVDPKEQQVQHTCNNPICVNPGHLVLGTDLDNQTYKKLCGRAVGFKGETNNHAILTENQVREILKVCHIIAGIDLAKTYGVSPTAISRIRTGKYWQHLREVDT